MKESTYKKLKMLETARRPHHTDDKRLKVYYGWSKINKVQKREAIAVAFENQEGPVGKTVGRASLCERQ